MIRRISRKIKMQSKNSAGRHRLLTPREETKAARDIRLGLSKSAADASFDVKKPDRSVNPKTITRTFKRKGLKSGKKRQHFHLIMTGKRHDMIGQRLIKTGPRLIGNALSFLMRQRSKKEGLMV